MNTYFIEIGLLVQSGDEDAAVDTVLSGIWEADVVEVVSYEIAEEESGNVKDADPIGCPECLEGNCKDAPNGS